MRRSATWIVWTVCVLSAISAAARVQAPADAQEPPDVSASKASSATQPVVIQDGASVPGSQPTTNAATRPATQTAPRAASADDPLRSPRATMRTFLVAVSDAEDAPERIKEAITCLDLSELEQGTAAEQGANLARQLEEVISHLGVTLAAIPDREQGEPYVSRHEPKISIARQADGRWRFAPETVAAIPELHDALRKTAMTQPAETPTDVPPERRSARATMQTFLEVANAGKWKNAADCLDLTEIPVAARREIGKEQAAKLAQLLRRVKVVVLQEIPDEPVGAPYVWHMDDHGRIALARQDSGDRKGEWLFTAATVKSIVELYESYEDRPNAAGAAGPAFWREPALWLRSQIPSTLKQEHLGLQDWQWLALALLLLIGALVRGVTAWLLGALARRLLLAKHIAMDAAALNVALRPLSFLAMVGVWWWGLKLLDLSIDAQLILWPVAQSLLAFIGVWTCYRLVDLVTAGLAALASRTITRLDDLVVPLLRKTLKVVVFTVGLVLIARVVGMQDKDVNKILAGLGLGGLAFSLAAQDTVRNFFGSLTIVFDRPFRVGDWIKVGNVEGTVESVGLYSSRIRTGHDSRISMPNSMLSSAVVDNLGARRWRLLKFTLAVSYATPPERLEAFCEALRELIRKHPHARQDEFQVCVHDLTPNAIDILVQCSLQVTGGAAEATERHKLLLDILRTARRMNIETASPKPVVQIVKESEAVVRTGEESGVER